MKRTSLLTALLALTLSLPAFAEHHPITLTESTMAQQLQQMPGDVDEKEWPMKIAMPHDMRHQGALRYVEPISLDQFMNQARDRFLKMDTNSDGMLSPDERSAGFKTKMKHRKSKEMDGGLREE